MAFLWFYKNTVNQTIFNAVFQTKKIYIRSIPRGLIIVGSLVSLIHKSQTVLALFSFYTFLCKIFEWESLEVNAKLENETFPLIYLDAFMQSV